MSLDNKIKTVFAEESVFKTPERDSVFSGFTIPSFVKDWLIKRFTDEEGVLDEYSLKNFISENLVYKDKQIKGTLLTDRKEVTLLARIVIEPDIKAGILRFSIPDAGLKMNECRVPDYVAREHPELKGGEVWGIVTLSYLAPEGNEKGEIKLEDLKGKHIIGGRRAGMPVMILENTLKENNINPKTDLNIQKEDLFPLI